MDEISWKSPRNIAFGAMLSAFAAGIQASSLYLPFLGNSLSALATLPVALAAYLNPATGFLVYLSAGGLLLFLTPVQALLFLCATGLLGLTLGITIRRGYTFPAAVVVSAALFSAGIAAAGKILGLAVLPWFAGIKGIMLWLLLFLCSLVYTSLWVPVLSAVFAGIRRINSGLENMR